MLEYITARYDIDSIDGRNDQALALFADTFEPLFDAWFKPVTRGLERIPDGGVLYVGNHSGALLTPDTFTFGLAAYRQRGIDFVPYGLGHEVIISLPPFHQLLVPLGAVRAGHANAHKLFEAGRKVLVYPGGDLDAMRSYRDRDRVIFGQRRGYIRLALQAGVPIAPIATVGAHETLLILSDGKRIARKLGIDRLLRLKVFPVALSIPWGLTVGPPPTHFPLPTRILTEVLPAIRFERSGPEAAADADYVEQCHEQVLGALQSAVTRLAAERRATGGKRFL